MSTIGRVKSLIQKTLEIPQLRTDGTLVKGTHPYRRLMPFIMPGSNESVCYYDDYIRVDKMLDYIERARAAYGVEVNITHLLVAADLRLHLDKWYGDGLLVRLRHRRPARLHALGRGVPVPDRDERRWRVRRVALCLTDSG